METSFSPPPPPVPTAARPAAPKSRSVFRVLLIIFGVLVLGCGIAAATTAWWVKENFYASTISPVSLTAAEQQTLDAKLLVLERPAAGAQPATAPGEAQRSLVISAKEINAYLAQQDLGEKVKVDLGHGTVAATMIVPVPADAPMFGGTTLRVKVTLSAAMTPDRKLAVEVNDITVGGVSLPNAWLGDIKGVNLLGDNVVKDPGLQRLMAGIQTMEITPAGLRVVLNE